MKKNKYSTPLWMLATILAGMLSPMQSAVNGQLGHWLQDGNACAVISFASGLVVMFFIIMARKETRQQFAAIPSLIKNRKVPLWNWFAGLCGAMVVFSEGASASALGVATFQTALISALLLSGLLCDRFGIGVDEKKYFTPYRIIGALFAVIPSLSRVRAEASFRNNPPGIPLRLCHRNPPVYLRTATFPIIFYVSPRLLCR